MSSLFDGVPPEPEASSPKPKPAAERKGPRRFYTDVTVLERQGTFAVALDGRIARTGGREPLAFPTLSAAEAVAMEWRAQEALLDPATMPLTRIANSAIDGVAREMAAVRADVVRYAGSDMLCYRAEAPASLVAEQAAAWDPILAWARETLGAQFVLSRDIVFVAQPPEAVAVIQAEVERLTEPVALACLHVMTTLTGSVLIALAVAHGRIDVDTAWTAAHVDEDHQIRAWGADADALERRAARRREMDAAATLLRLSR